MKKTLKKFLPDREKLSRYKSLRFLQGTFGDTKLWHFSRHSTPGAAFIGIFVCLLPIPFHMVLAALLAVKFRCNLPLAVALVWVNTPVTYVPVFYFNYRVGAWIMGMHHPAMHPTSFHWLLEQLTPLWLGSIICATVAGGIAYLLLKLGWRITILRHWRKRQGRNNKTDASE